MPDQCPYARVACFSGAMLCEVKRGGDARSGRFRRWWRGALGALGAYDCHCGGILPCALCAAKQKRDRKGEP